MSLNKKYSKKVDAPKPLQDRLPDRLRPAPSLRPQLSHLPSNLPSSQPFSRPPVLRLPSFDSNTLSPPSPSRASSSSAASSTRKSSVSSSGTGENSNLAPASSSTKNTENVRRSAPLPARVPKDPETLHSLTSLQSATQNSRTVASRLMSPVASVILRERGLNVSTCSPRPATMANTSEILSPTNSLRSGEKNPGKSSESIPEMSPISDGQRSTATSSSSYQQSFKKRINPFSKKDDDILPRLNTVQMITPTTPSSDRFITTPVRVKRFTSHSTSMHIVSNNTNVETLSTPTIDKIPSKAVTRLASTPLSSSTDSVNCGEESREESKQSTQDSDSLRKEVEDEMRNEKNPGVDVTPALKPESDGAGSSMQHAATQKDTQKTIEAEKESTSNIKTEAASHRQKPKPKRKEKSKKAGMEPTHGRRKSRKKAVVIGISYVNSGSLGTSFQYGEAARKWYDILVRRMEFISDEIRLLTDIPVSNQGNASIMPANAACITAAMKWLTDGTKPGDRLFFTYSGDVGETPNPSDQQRYFVVPADFPADVFIWENDFEEMIRRVPRGVEMFIVLDCRHSWSLVRLPFIYLPVKMQRKGYFELQSALTPESWSIPELPAMATKTIMSFTRAGQERERQELERHRQLQREQTIKYKDCAKIVCFAASPAKYRKFHVTGTHPLCKGEYVDAFILAIDQIYQEGKSLTYANMMMHMANRLSPPGQHNQVPQVSATNELDLNSIIKF